MSKKIREYTVKGKFNDEDVYLELTVYPENIRKAKPKGLKTSRASSWKRKTAAIVLAGALATGGIAGYNAINKQENNNIAVEQELNVNTLRIEYKVKNNDTLWDIASKYTTPVTVENEIAKIAALNGIKEDEVIYPGQVIKIDIPKDRTEAFIVEATEAKNMKIENYLYNEIEQISQGVSKENVYYWRLKEEMTEHLRSAASHRYDLNEMQSFAEIYGEERIAAKRRMIISEYENTIAKLNSLGTKYNYSIDQILDIPEMDNANPLNNSNLKM